MTDTLRTFAEQVTGVAREVGTEGVLGGQAEVPSAAGTWRDLTDSVNVMAANLTDQVRQIAQVTTAVANGDLTQKVTVEAKGEVAALAETINDMTDTLRTFAEQVTGVAREVGTHGVLGGQADVPGVAGTWKDLTDSVNSMATNLTDQVRNIAEVTTAVANGDLSAADHRRRAGRDPRAQADDQHDGRPALAPSPTRSRAWRARSAPRASSAARPRSRACRGTWRDLTENVNFLAGNLTDQVRNIAQVTTAVAHGDLSQKITVDAQGEILELKNTINTMVDQLSSFADEVTRVAREVGTEGKLGGQAEVEGVSGTWRGLTENVNLMATNLTDQVRNIAQVTTAVANGDLTQKISVDARGRDPRAQGHHQHDGRPAARVRLRGHARGPRGGHRGQARRPGRGRGRVGHVARPDREREPDGDEPDRPGAQHRRRDDRRRPRRPDAQDHRRRAGRDRSSSRTPSTRWSTSSRRFADEVTRVAREVGTEGQLGGQAEVKGVSRHLARPDRERQPARQQPDQPGAQHRRR